LGPQKDIVKKRMRAQCGVDTQQNACQRQTVDETSRQVEHELWKVANKQVGSLPLTSTCKQVTAQPVAFKKNEAQAEKAEKRRIDRKVRALRFERRNKLKGAYRDR